MVEKLSIRQGDEPVFDMEGSIALNENPTIEFDYRRNGAPQLTATARDTNGTEFTIVFEVGAGS